MSNLQRREKENTATDAFYYILTEKVGHVAIDLNTVLPFKAENLHT